MRYFSKRLRKRCMSSEKVYQNAEEGRLLIADPFTDTPLRIAILDPELLASLADSTAHFGLGQKWAESFYSQMIDKLSNTDRSPRTFLKEEFIENLNGFFSYCGIAQFRILEGNQFYVIDLKNSFPFREYDIFAGFFSSLFSSVSDRLLSCIVMSQNSERIRCCLSTPEVIKKIESALNSGETETTILERYQNLHLA